MTETPKRATTRQVRRAPAPDERTLDAERSRCQLLDAALEEFSAKGYAGARVQDIADRAGVNKQLINYYFGGKEGLYCELHRRWARREAEFNDPAVPFDEIVVRYLRHVLDDPRGSRLDAWRGLTEDLDDVPSGPREDLSDIERRQAAGELPADLDPAAVMLAVMAMVSAPVTKPLAVRHVFGADPRSPEFQEHYAEQLRRIVRHLMTSPADDESRSR
ncbi:TetR/AcrR family transcriptional regulator [Actinomadura sp. WMMA1423]|uniref:TetR/AcrR family transcriptional regulator n=1 Tax=Actinomadura sp. WMMA1423 TaxID=2591108 RepID=UPI001F0D16B9|nr:TetR family transcriptional regulator [Actinomadura sp. WMMA1423]